MYVPDGQSLTGSRQSLLRLAKEKSIQITNQTITEIAIANQQNSHIIITNDDGQLTNGNQENLRTYQVQYMNSEGELTRRYLTSFDAIEKSAKALKQSLDRVKAKFEPSSYSLCTDDAITNLAMARLDGNTQINLCGPHGVNRAAIMATDETEVQDSEFKVFNRTLRRFMEKSSRCKYNQKFLNNDGWIKFK